MTDYDLVVSSTIYKQIEHDIRESPAILATFGVHLTDYFADNSISFCVDGILARVEEFNASVYSNLASTTFINGQGLTRQPSPSNHPTTAASLLTTKLVTMGESNATQCSATISCLMGATR